MYNFSMMLVIVATALYNICQKSIDESINPFISMTVTYTVALVFSIISLCVFPHDSIGFSLKEVNWASYLLGFAILILEMGFLLVYRSGWEINTATLFANILTTLVLIVVGSYFYKEQLSVVNVSGIFLSVVGLILMRR